MATAIPERSSEIDLVLHADPHSSGINRNSSIQKTARHADRRKKTIGSRIGCRNLGPPGQNDTKRQHRELLSTPRQQGKRPRPPVLFLLFPLCLRPYASHQPYAPISGPTDRLRLQETGPAVGRIGLRARLGPSRALLVFENGPVLAVGYPRARKFPEGQT